MKREASCIKYTNFPVESSTKNAEKTGEYMTHLRSSFDNLYQKCPF